jgi:hypothetical protein
VRGFQGPVNHLSEVIAHRVQVYGVLQASRERGYHLVGVVRNVTAWITRRQDDQGRRLNTAVAVRLPQDPVSDSSDTAVRGSSIDRTAQSANAPIASGATWTSAPGTSARPGSRRTLPAGLFPTMTSLADEFALADPDERFEILLDIFVDGPARRATTEAQR